MRILAFDPGYERLGIAVVERTPGSKECLLYSDCFKTAPTLPFTARLHALGQEVERVIAEYAPDSVALERLYFNKNQKTAMHVAEVRGVLTYLAMAHNLTFFEYTPQEIKVAVTGYGAGAKADVAKMVPMLVKITKRIAHDDEYDAIAVGLTCLAHVRH